MSAFSSNLLGLPKPIPTHVEALADAVRKADKRIRPVAAETPLVTAEVLGRRLGVAVVLKLETHQPTGSFKLRGATAKLTLLSPEARAKGVVAASTGNHGLAVAHAGRALGARVRVHVPSSGEPSKLSAIEALGAEVVRGAGDCLAAETRARADASRTGATFVSPYNDLDVVAGQGTCGLEMARQAPPLDAVFVAAGGGGLVAGVAAAFASHSAATGSPRPRIIACQPHASAVMGRWVAEGRTFDVPEEPTFSDATAGDLERDTVTFPLCRTLVDAWTEVSEAEIANAFRLLVNTEHWVVEGAAAVAVAAAVKEADALRGRRIGIILCGRNAGAGSIAAMLAGAG